MIRGRERIIAVGIAALGSIATFFFPAPSQAATIPPCSADSKAVYSAYPVKLSRLSHITPIGNLNPTAGHIFPTSHLYFILNEGADGTKTRLNAPGDIVITKIGRSHNLTADTSDYSLYFQGCEDVNGYFLHVSSISSRLQKKFAAVDKDCYEYTAGDSDYRLCNASELTIGVDSGEKIGTVGENGSTFDFGGYDTRTTPHRYANQDRWDEVHQHIVCSLNYFTSKKKTALREKLGNGEGKKRSGRYPCGKKSQDKLGTLQGAWFKQNVEGTSWDESYQLALVHQVLEPEIPLFSVGKNVAEIPVRAYEFTATHAGRTNRDFDETTTKRTYCYELSGESGRFTVLARLKNKRTLKMEKKNAETCDEGSWKFTGQAKTYVR